MRQERGWLYLLPFGQCRQQGCRAPVVFNAVVSPAVVPDVEKVLEQLFALKDKVPAKEANRFLFCLLRFQLGSKNLVAGFRWFIHRSIAFRIFQVKMAVIAPVDLLGKLLRQIGNAWGTWQYLMLANKAVGVLTSRNVPVYQGIPAGSSEAGIGRESVIARGRASVVLTAIDVGVLGEAI